MPLRSGREGCLSGASPRQPTVGRGPVEAPEAHELGSADRSRAGQAEHGFRATFRTWAEEVATFPHAVVEQAMGHQVGTVVERAYRRTDVLEKRRELMEAWVQWCEPKAAIWYRSARGDDCPKPTDF